MDILYGKPLASKILNEVKDGVAKLDKRPILVVVCAEQSSPFYKGIIKDAEICGIATKTYSLRPEYSDIYDVSDFTYNTLIDGIVSLNKSYVPPEALNMDGGMAIPCVARATMALLGHYGIYPRRKNVTIINRSERVGRPLAKLMLDSDATVTVCHRKTQNLIKHARRADILISCAGDAEFNNDFIPKNGVLVDLGGDFPDAKMSTCTSLVPAVGGVGPVTRALLLQNVYMKALVKQTTK